MFFKYKIIDSIIISTNLLYVIQLITLSENRFKEQQRSKNGSLFSGVFSFSPSNGYLLMLSDSISIDCIAFNCIILNEFYLFFTLYIKID